MDYEIKGDNFPVLMCKLKPNEKLITKTGSMSWHTQGISIIKEDKGNLGNVIRKVLIGNNSSEEVYQAYFDKQEITLTPKRAGSIKSINVESIGEGLIVQETALLAYESTVKPDVMFQKKLGIGFFGGEKFTMLRLTGEGLAFLEINGSAHEHTLDRGSKLVVSAGHLLAMDYTCRVSVESMGNFKNTVFGNEGAWHATVYGPGKVYLQSMPLINLKSALGIGAQSENKSKKETK